MKKLLVLGAIASLLLPSLAFAVADDVSLTTDTVVSVNGIGISVSGTTATIESIEVGSTSFSVVLPAGASFEVTASGLNQLSTDNTLWKTAATTCTGSASVLGYNNPTGDEITVTVTPSATLCANATVTSPSSKGDARSGGGGGAIVATPVPPVIIPVVGTNAEAIAIIKTSLISLIQQLIILLNQEIQNMQAAGNY